MEEESDEEVKANVVNTESAKKANDEVQETKQEKNGNYVIYFDFTKFQKKNFLLLISRKNNSQNLLRKNWKKRSNAM